MSLVHTALLLLCLIVAGCQPSVVGPSDEQKDPYFLAGKNRLQARDYDGAIQNFEKALDVNPRSASAHFELAVLYEQQQSDYVAGLYHYHRALTLNSNGPSAELARQRIQECKREIAKTVTQPITMEHMQRELDSLRAENHQLKSQLTLWQRYYEGRGVTLSNLVATPNAQSAAQPRASAAATPASPASGVSGQSPTPNVRSEVPTPSAVRPASPTRQVTTSRTHVVMAGETLALIARRHGVKVSAIQNANPTVDARRLRPGQTLVIPAP
jgi:LysM repeat protein